MSLYALHRGVQYEMSEVVPGQWQWAFAPPTGPRRSGRVQGEFQFALTVVRRAIDVWHLMNRGQHDQAA